MTFSGEITNHSFDHFPPTTQVVSSSLLGFTAALIVSPSSIGVLQNTESHFPNAPGLLSKGLIITASNISPYLSIPSVRRDVAHHRAGPEQPHVFHLNERRSVETRSFAERVSDNNNAHVASITLPQGTCKKRARLTVFFLSIFVIFLLDAKRFHPCQHRVVRRSMLPRSRHTLAHAAKALVTLCTSWCCSNSVRSIPSIRFKQNGERRKEECASAERKCEHIGATTYTQLCVRPHRTTQCSHS